MENLCDTCTQHTATCTPEIVVFGLDRGAKPYSKDADAIVECTSYISVEERHE